MTDSTDAAWAAARAAEPGSMTRDEIAAVLNHVRKARACLDAIEVQASRRIRELAASGRAEPAESMIGNAGGHSGRGAEAVTARDELCEEMPAVEDALAEGDITAGYVDAIAAAARMLPEQLRAEYAAMSDALLARAGRLSLDSFRRECRQLAKELIARSRAGDEVDELAEQRAASKLTRWVDDTTGMHHTHLELDPIRDGRLHSLANAELARLRAANGSKDVPWSQLLIDAFVNAAAGISTTTDHASSEDATTDDATADSGATKVAEDGAEAAVPGDPSGSQCDGRCRQRTTVDRVPEILGLVTLEFLAGHVDSGVCETENGVPIPIATMRRLCCDAEIIPVVMNGDGEALDVGRAKRTATAPQRRALRAMHRGCAHPDCNMGFDACRIHHIRWWWRDLGPTDIDNLLPLCERHHHLVHEGGWELTMTPDRVATWRRPDGTLYHHGSTIDRIGAPSKVA